MKTHTSSFKENIAKFGRELDSKITYTLNNEEIELGNEELNSVSLHYEGAILKSVMKQLDIDSNVEIPLETILTYEFGRLHFRDEEAKNCFEQIFFDYIDESPWMIIIKLIDYIIDIKMKVLTLAITLYMT